MSEQATTRRAPWRRCVVCGKRRAMGRPYRRDICRPCHGAKLLGQVDAILARWAARGMEAQG